MPRMKMHDPPVFVSANPSRNYNDGDRTRTALGAAIHWYPAYNDGIQDNAKTGGIGIGFGEVTRTDNRAAAGGPASWSASGPTNRVLWDEKFTGPNRDGSSPTAWVETKSGISSEVRDRLLREKENPSGKSRMAATVHAASAASVAPAKDAAWSAGAREGKNAKYFDSLSGRLGPPWGPPQNPVNSGKPMAKKTGA